MRNFILVHLSRHLIFRKIDVIEKTGNTETNLSRKQVIIEKVEVLKDFDNRHIIEKVTFRETLSKTDSIEKVIIENIFLKNDFYRESTYRKIKLLSRNN